MAVIVELPEGGESRYEVMASLSAAQAVITIGDERYIGWTADALEYSTLLLSETRPDGSGIDEITIEGGHAFGQATFIDIPAVFSAHLRNEAPPPSFPGTFDIRCG